MVVVKVGRQSLATFLVSLVAARTASLAFHLLGDGFLVSLVINLAAIGLVIATAYVVGWFKSNPWLAPRVGAARAVQTVDEIATGDAKPMENAENHVTKQLLLSART